MRIMSLSGAPDIKLRELTDTSVDKRKLRKLGLLLGLRLNVYQVAENLRWAYLPDQALKNRGLSYDQIIRLRKAHAAAEHEFIRAGGNREQFKKAILDSAGNQDRQVPVQSLAGFGSSAEDHILRANISTLLRSLNPQQLGSTATNTQALNSADSTLNKIASISQSVADIARSVDQARAGGSVPATTTTTPSTPAQTKQAGFGNVGEWVKENKMIAFGGAALLAGLFITQMDIDLGDVGGSAMRTKKPKKGASKLEYKPIS